jgi:hypothetical protein
VKLFQKKLRSQQEENSNWWKDPRLDDEGTYDYLAEELPSDNSRWSWYYAKCDDCGKYHKLNVTDSHYFYCWDGWDSMSYTTCWRCRMVSITKSSIRKVKKFIQHHHLKIDVEAYKIFRQYCKKHNIPKEQRKDLWLKYYDDIWHDKAMRKIVRGVK